MSATADHLPDRAETPARRADRPSVAFGLLFLAVALWAGLERLGLTLVGARWAVPAVLVAAGLLLLSRARRKRS